MIACTVDRCLELAGRICIETNCCSFGMYDPVVHDVAVQFNILHLRLTLSARVVMRSAGPTAIH